MYIKKKEIYKGFKWKKEILINLHEGFTVKEKTGPFLPRLETSFSPLTLQL